MTSLICRRYLCLQRTWNVHRKHTSNCIGIASNLSKTVQTSRSSSIHSWSIASKPNYCHFNLIAALSSTIQCCTFATKQDLVHVKEKHTKAKLNKGEVACIVRDQDGVESTAEGFSLDALQKKVANLDRFTANNTARSCLNNYGLMYKSMTGKDMNLKYQFSRCSAPDASPVPASQKAKKPVVDTHWSCSVKLKLPVPVEVKAVGQSKAAVGDLVAKLILSEFIRTQQISIKGRPVLNAEEKKALAPPTRDQPVDRIDSLHTACSSLDSLNNATSQYEKEIAPLLFEFEIEVRQAAEEKKQAEESKVPVDEEFMKQIERFSRPVHTRQEEQRNRQLERKAITLRAKCEQSLASGQRKKLPIEDYRQEIVSNISSNPITIIKGEPGCGKSTQVAQMILNEASLSGNGSSCNILITQPRRISAISLAKRVAAERDEMVGDSVGYHVRLQHMFPRNRGHIQFITTGILLTRLQSQQGLDSVSHIILDEAHERDISTDLLLLLTKNLLQTHPHLRLIIMSATMNAEMFQRYYTSSPVLHIPGFTYPVQRHYLTVDNCKKWNLVNREDSMSALVSSREPTTNADIISNLILWIHRNKPDGAILCFLPGWQDMLQVSRCLASSRDGRSLLVTMAHSKLDTEVQGAIFDHPPPGVRKVVLATNVAETSITIDDVGYVVDTGCHKEKRYNAHDDLVSLDNHWVSRASVNQRAGRAGRTKPGESFHLYSEDRFRKMVEYSMPEIFRVPLEQILVLCKIYSNEKCASFLSQLPEPPDSTSIRSAVNELTHMGVFDEEENLTSLGKRIAAIQAHPKLAKALVESVVYKCALPMGNIVTMLATSERPMFENSLHNNSKDAIRDLKSNLSSYSDHIAGSKIFSQWANEYERRGGQIRNMPDGNYLHQKNLKHLYSVRSQIMENLYTNRLLEDHTNWMLTNTGSEYEGLRGEEDEERGAQSVNAMAGVDEWVRGVLYSGVQNLLLAKTARGKRRLVTEQGQLCIIVKDSVNSGLKSTPCPTLVYYDATTSLQRRITSVRDTSVLSPLSVLLFRRGTATLLNEHEAQRIKCDLKGPECIVSLENENEVCNLIVPDHDQARLLLRLRNILSRMSKFFIAHQGHAPCSPSHAQSLVRINAYWDGLLGHLVPLFQHYTRKDMCV
uniref:ATP-dependent RNA helicase DHX30 n=1 Tax=Cacopsylla melanoneura TaxID=428564 RepID=A0A8D9B9T8_9HEMI